MFADVSDYTSSMVKDLFNTEIGYNTPKIESRGVISKNNSILFVREKDDGNWSLPGGMVDQNETPSQLSGKYKKKLVIMSKPKSY